MSYLREDAGQDIRCSRCGQSIRLPGKLERIAGIKPARSRDLLGIGMEVGGFVLMFFFFPWGLLVGGVLVFLGWKKCNAWLCESCGTKLKSRWVEICPKCRTKFGAE